MEARLVDIFCSLHTYVRVGGACGLLALGAVIEHFLPAAMFWFLGISGVACLLLLGICGIGWVALAAEWPKNEDNYPGS